MVDSAEFTRWRAEADVARRSAALQASADVYNWACFLAEQAAQLGVKALLHGIGGAPCPCGASTRLALALPSCSPSLGREPIGSERCHDAIRWA